MNIAIIPPNGVYFHLTAPMFGSLKQHWQAAAAAQALRKISQEA